MPLVLRDLGNEYSNWDCLLQIAAEYPVKSFLEVGTRYGDSLLRVLAGVMHSDFPHRLERIVISDCWHVSYFGAGNNGTQFGQNHQHIERMLTGLGYTREQVTFLDGDSGKTIPTLDKHKLFDLVHVDGDHDKEPARADLFNCWPLVAQGGFLVFDDIQSDEHMAPLWHYFCMNATDIAEVQTRTNKKQGVGVARKQVHGLETTKIRPHVMKYFDIGSGIDIGSSRDPLTKTCVAYDKSDWPEVTRRGDVRSLPFADNEFDWAWSSHTLEDLSDPHAGIREWLRVIKPGGLLGLYVPHPELYAKYGGGNTDHQYPGFYPEDLEKILISQNCEIIESRVDDDISVREFPHYSTLVVARKKG